MLFIGRFLCQRGRLVKYSARTLTCEQLKATLKGIHLAPLLPRDLHQDVPLDQCLDQRVGRRVDTPSAHSNISSLALTAEQLAAAVREHWGVENRLHWVLDVGVSEDTKDNAPQNLSMLRNIALTIIRTDKTDTRKSSLRLKRTGAAWDDGVRERLLGEGLLEGVADFGCHLDHDTEQFLAALRHGDRQIDAAADLHRPDTQTTAGRRVGHQTVRQKGMQGDDGFRIDADVFGIAHQIFDGRLVVEDHLGFQSILAPNSAPFRTDAQRVADAAERFASCCSRKPLRLVRCTRLFRIGAVS